MSDVTWTPTTIPLRALTPWERNPKRISKTHAARLLELWERLGQFQTIAIGPAGEVYDGHQRLSVLKAAHGGKYEVTALQSSRALTEKEREELTVAAHVGTVGQFSWEDLSGWDAGDLQSWGFDTETLTNWQTDIGALRTMLDAEQAPTGDDPGAQVDKAAELQAKWGTATGQMWLLDSGNGYEHRLICGDCTDAAVVAAVAFGDRIDLWVSDPPYGVSYADKNKYLNAVAKGNRIQTPIANDHLTLDEATNLWRKAFGVVFEIAKPGCVYYVNAPQGGDLMMMMMMLRESGWLLKPQIIWVKNNHVLGRSDYQLKHEPILYGWKEGSHFWNGSRSEMSVWQVDKPQNSDFHPTTKPVELAEKAIQNSSQPGELVFDGFLGSGTTLIAAERLGRRCRAVEIEPGYVAVALQRFYDMTGIEPVLLEPGNSDLTVISNG